MTIKLSMSEAHRIFPNGINEKSFNAWFEKNHSDKIFKCFIHDISIDAIQIEYKPKPEEQIFRENFEYLINRLPESPRPENAIERKLRITLEGKCPECEMKIKGYKPYFGYFAPEIWESSRENGIDPSTGHRMNCKSKHIKL